MSKDEGANKMREYIISVVYGAEVGSSPAPYRQASAEGSWAGELPFTGAAIAEANS